MQEATKARLRRSMPETLYYFLAELYFLPRQLLMLNFVRFIICFARKIYYVNIMRALRTVDSLPEGVSKNTIMHNLDGICDLAVRRSYRLIRPVMTIDKVHKAVGDLKVLTIGPRAEGEIYNLIGHGFKAKNIRGLDLISYSPYVDLGDMHKMPYEDNSFDIIFIGWVLAYSDDRIKAAKEIIRVAKPGAIIAIGSSCTLKTNDEVIEDCGYLPGSEDRIDSLKKLLGYFGDNVDHQYFAQDFNGDDKEFYYSIISVFSVKK